jgi:hypothetical protein
MSRLAELCLGQVGAVVIRDRLEWSAEKNAGPVSRESAPPAVTYLSETLAGCSVCTDCGLTEIPCMCCLECGEVQARRMKAYERCAACVAERVERAA